MTSCSGWRLYVIIDRAAVGDRELAQVASAAIRGGADAIQLRDKAASSRQLVEEAVRLVPLTRAAGIPLIINDRADIARCVGADGVHVGQEDLPITAARAVVGPEGMIGTSTHSLEQALAAEAEGADYIGFGPMFATPTKPDYRAVGLEPLREIVTRIHIPVVAIGGIDQGNLEQVLRAGAERVAVVRAVCAAADPEASTRALKTTLAQFHRSRAAARL